MSDSKTISHREFETYLRVKEFIERNGYEETDLKTMTGYRKPSLIIHSDDMEQRDTNVYQKQLMTSEF